MLVINHKLKNSKNKLSIITLFIFLGTALTFSTTLFAHVFDFSNAIKQNVSVVVSIEAHHDVLNKKQLKKQHKKALGEYYDHFKSELLETKSKRYGSGFFIGSDGYILTAAHVVSGAKKIKVNLANKKQLNAKVIGYDEEVDIAVIKIKGSNFSVARFSNKNQPQAGSWVLAIGAPFGFELSSSVGIVSATARLLDESPFPLIQTDVAANPGNSGGPLFNTSGEVIGMMAQIYSNTGSFTGVSFAVPIELITQMLPRLITDGQINKGSLGVLVRELTFKEQRKHKLEGIGLMVDSVKVEQESILSGLQAGDIITHFNGREMRKIHDLSTVVTLSEPGSVKKVSILRNDKELSIEMKINKKTK